jgi:D-lactate dehydrogenase
MKIVGQDNIILKNNNNIPASFLKGARVGGGVDCSNSNVLCVITPDSLMDIPKCVQEIVDAGVTIIAQGSNTSLTGGSVPRPGNTTTTDRRPTVILNTTKHLSTIFPIDNGRRVVCCAGAGLADLSRFLEDYFPTRESHSVLGSTFLNPTCSAGVALGSGGTQCLRKGSAYTDRALYLKVHRNKWGENVVQVVNTLHIDGLEDSDFPYDSGSALEQLDIYQKDIRDGYQRAMAVSSKNCGDKLQASDVGYAERLCRLDDNAVARCNADTRGEDCNRSEGKVLILATVHDTFPKPTATRSFWLSFDNLQTALEFRRQVCLDNPNDLPISLEYMDRDSFDVIDQGGRVLANVIKLVGTTSPIVKRLWNIKLWIDSLPGFDLWSDRMLYRLNSIMPATLPSNMMQVGKAMDHHIAMTVGEFGGGNMERLLDRMQEFASKHGQDKIVIHECQTSAESASLSAFRFVAAPAFRTWCVGQGLQGFSVDYALPKNRGNAPSLSTKPVKRMRYSHFGCNVVHEDLAYASDVDMDKAKMELKKTVEHDCGGKLPAEHGHGIEYVAPPETQERWKRMDPLNVLNPGIGGLNDQYQYKD